MSVADADGGVDRAHDRLVVIFNANDQAQTLTVSELQGKPLVLHPLQALSLDPVERTSSFNRAAGSFSVPARTAAVFWSWRPVADQIRLLIQDVQALGLSAGNTNALLAKLQAALQQAERGNRTPAASQLGAFTNQVRDFASQGLLTEEDAERLTDNANLAILTLFL